MLKIKRSLVVGLIMVFVVLLTTPAFSGSINFKDAGIPLWIFVISGATIVVLQLIPTAILFFSFIGTASLIVFKLKKVLEECLAKEKQKIVLPGYEATTIKKKSRSEKWEI